MWRTGVEVRAEEELWAVESLSADGEDHVPPVLQHVVVHHQLIRVLRRCGARGTESEGTSAKEQLMSVMN